MQAIQDALDAAIEEADAGEKPLCQSAVDRHMPKIHVNLGGLKQFDTKRQLAMDVRNRRTFAGRHVCELAKVWNRALAAQRATSTAALSDGSRMLCELEQAVIFLKIKRTLHPSLKELQDTFGRAEGMLIARSLVEVLF